METTKTTTNHKTELRPAGNYHRAACSCGWEGKRRYSMRDARTEAQRHEDDAR